MLFNVKEKKLLMTNDPETRSTFSIITFLYYFLCFSEYRFLRIIVENLVRLSRWLKSKILNDFVSRLNTCGYSRARSELD